MDTFSGDRDIFRVDDGMLRQINSIKHLVTEPLKIVIDACYTYLIRKKNNKPSTIQTEPDLREEIKNYEYTLGNYLRNLSTEYNPNLKLENIKHDLNEEELKLYEHDLTYYSHISNIVDKLTNDIIRDNKEIDYKILEQLEFLSYIKLLIFQMQHAIYTQINSELKGSEYEHEPPPYTFNSKDNKQEFIKRTKNAIIHDIEVFNKIAPQNLQIPVDDMIKQSQLNSDNDSQHISLTNRTGEIIGQLLFVLTVVVGVAMGFVALSSLPKLLTTSTPAQQEGIINTVKAKAPQVVNRIMAVRNTQDAIQLLTTLVAFMAESQHLNARNGLIVLGIVATAAGLRASWPQIKTRFEELMGKVDANSRTSRSKIGIESKQRLRSKSKQKSKQKSKPKQRSNSKSKKSKSKK